MPSTSTLVDSIYTRRVSAGECYPPDLVKSHNKKTVTLLIVALVLGAAGAGLSVLHLNAREVQLREALRPKSQPIAVVVASRDLVKGDKLDTSTLSVRRIPQDYVDPNAVRPNEFEAIKGQVLIQNLAKGKPLLKSFIGREFPLDFSDTIPEQRRAMTVQVDEINSISGLIRPGNHVDLFVNLPASALGDKAQQKKGQPSNQILPVLENAEVLATGQSTARDYEEKVRLLRGGVGARPDSHYTNLTLNVTPKEAALLAIALDKGACWRCCVIARTPAVRVSSRSPPIPLRVTRRNWQQRPPSVRPPPVRMAISSSARMGLSVPATARCSRTRIWWWRKTAPS